MISVEELTRIRPKVGTVVDALSFTARPGQVTAFLGPNGAGKSTTMRMILGLERPTRGSAMVCGRPYPTLARPLHHVGALLDARTAHPHRSARAHLWWLARSHGMSLPRVDEVLNRVGLTPAARRRVGTFSLGMGQRLGLAAALLGDPEVLILDEPANGLDPEGMRWLRSTMRGLADEGRTLLVSSHLMTEMRAVADHVVLIGEGRLLADASPDELLRSQGTDSLEQAFLNLTAGSTEHRSLT